MLVLSMFGLLTLFLSTSVIFDLFGIREMEGDYVLFVVVANFISSIFYLVSVYGIVKQAKWPPYVLGVSTILLIIAFVGLKMHISAGGLYEEKTVGAMIFRTTITFIFTLITVYVLSPEKIKR